MKNSKKVASTLLVCLAFSFSNSYAKNIDTDKWYKDSINFAVEQNWLKGYIDGDIKPDDYIKRCEFATITNRVLKSSKTKSLENFKDISKDKWYFEEISKAVNAEILKGDDKGFIHPEENITREEAFVAIARIIGINSDDISEIDLKDAGKISSWSNGSIKNLLKHGYIKGSQGYLRPKENITRAEFIQILNNIISDNLNQDGIYKKLPDGNILVTSKDVIIKDEIIAGDLLVAEGANKGKVTLDNIKLSGRLFVRGNTEVVVINNSEIGNIELLSKNAKVNLEKDTILAKTNIEKDSIIEKNSKVTVIEEIKAEVLEASNKSNSSSNKKRKKSNNNSDKNKENKEEEKIEKEISKLEKEIEKALNKKNNKLHHLKKALDDVNNFKYKDRLDKKLVIELKDEIDKLENKPVKPEEKPVVPEEKPVVPEDKPTEPEDETIKSEEIDRLVSELEEEIKKAIDSNNDMEDVLEKVENFEYKDRLNNSLVEELKETINSRNKLIDELYNSVVSLPNTREELLKVDWKVNSLVGQINSIKGRDTEKLKETKLILNDKIKIMHGLEESEELKGYLNLVSELSYEKIGDIDQDLILSKLNPMLGALQYKSAYGEFTEEENKKFLEAKNIHRNINDRTIAYGIEKRIDKITEDSSPEEKEEIIKDFEYNKEYLREGSFKEEYIQKIEKLKLSLKEKNEYEELAVKFEKEVRDVLNKDLLSVGSKLEEYKSENENVKEKIDKTLIEELELVYEKLLKEALDFIKNLPKTNEISKIEKSTEDIRNFKGKFDYLSGRGIVDRYNNEELNSKYRKLFEIVRLFNFFEDLKYVENGLNNLETLSIEEANNVLVKYNEIKESLNENSVVEINNLFPIQKVNDLIEKIEEKVEKSKELIELEKKIKNKLNEKVNGFEHGEIANVVDLLNQTYYFKDKNINIDLINELNQYFKDLCEELVARYEKFADVIEDKEKVYKDREEINEYRGDIQSAYNRDNNIVSEIYGKFRRNDMAITSPNYGLKRVIEIDEKIKDLSNISEDEYKEIVKDYEALEKYFNDYSTNRYKVTINDLISKENYNKLIDKFNTKQETKYHFIDLENHVRTLNDDLNEAKSEDDLNKIYEELEEIEYIIENFKVDQIDYENNKESILGNIERLKNTIKMKYNDNL